MSRVLAIIEQMQVAVWMREDAYAYFIALIAHAVGMALLVGAGIVVSLLVLRTGSSTSQPALQRLLPVLWLGASLAVISGLLLLVAYPAKALTNPVFAIKFYCLAGATALLGRLLRRDFATIRPRLLAAVSLALWLGGVAMGKLLLHTYRILTVS